MGKNTADTLSRAPTTEQGDEDVALEEEVEAFAAAVVESLPATQQRLKMYREAQEVDPVCIQLKHYCSHDWPKKAATSPYTGLCEAHLPRATSC